MLIELKCDLFRKNSLTFNEGLNVVLGDDNASNSIGKTTILMVIDFIFGGGSFLKNSGDAIEIFGNHQFRFAFKFSNEFFYFIRETDNSGCVTYCNEKYEPKEEITINEFRNFLKDKYNLNFLEYLSFREIISQYSRIYGKNNYDLKKPLNTSTEPDKNAIERLIKLFNKYKDIEQFDKNIVLLTNKKKSVNEASKYGFLPKTITKVAYNDALAAINEIETEITEISKDIEGERCNFDAIASKEIIDLKNETGKLRLNKNLKNNELQSIKINLTTHNKKIKAQISHLIDYFPNIDLDKLITIESFHDEISSILKEKLKERQKYLELEIRKIDENLSQLNEKIDKILSYDENEISKYALEKLIALAIQKAKFEDLIKIYRQKSLIETELKSDKLDLVKIKKEIQLNLNQRINSEIESLNKVIYSDGRIAPRLSLDDNKYSFNVLLDTGTGKAYTNLITLDLAIFSLTSLPILIHDSMLFKNIENPVIENIINIYNKQKKQIFISIDNKNRYKKNTQMILESQQILHLSSENTLYNSSWNKK